MISIPGRRLFSLAAVFNVVAALPLLIAGPALGIAIGMQPVPDRSLFEQTSLCAVLLFVWAYWKVSRDPVTYRPYIVLGIAGKLVFVVLIYAHWAMGSINAVLPLLASADVVFALLFWRFLARTPRPRP